jgi:hypothetical protein
MCRLDCDLGPEGRRNGGKLASRNAGIVKIKDSVTGNI